jgi:hypothetical protein
MLNLLFISEAKAPKEEAAKPKGPIKGITFHPVNSQTLIQGENIVKIYNSIYYLELILLKPVCLLIFQITHF